MGERRVVGNKVAIIELNVSGWSMHENRGVCIREGSSLLVPTIHPRCNLQIIE